MRTWPTRNQLNPRPQASRAPIGNVLLWKKAHKRWRRSSDKPSPLARTWNVFGPYGKPGKPKLRELKQRPRPLRARARKSGFRNRAKVAGRLRAIDLQRADAAQAQKKPRTPPGFLSCRENS